jgi:hypothetical protein
MTTETPIQRIWFRATLTPMAIGLFTEAFYPEKKQRTGAQHVFFAQADVTPSNPKVIVASKMTENGVRMMTKDLAQKCLIPTTRATRAEMTQLDSLTSRLKL